MEDKDFTTRDKIAQMYKNSLTSLLIDPDAEKVEFAGGLFSFQLYRVGDVIRCDVKLKEVKREAQEFKREVKS